LFRGAACQGSQRAHALSLDFISISPALLVLIWLLEAFEEPSHVPVFSSIHFGDHLESQKQNHS
jgi:hypothetical protein